MKGLSPGRARGSTAREVWLAKTMVRRPWRGRQNRPIKTGDLQFPLPGSSAAQVTSRGPDQSSPALVPVVLHTCGAESCSPRGGVEPLGAVIYDREEAARVWHRGWEGMTRAPCEKTRVTQEEQTQVT